MKKVLCACVCVLLLCSCSKSKAQVSVVTKGLSYTAHIFYYGEEYECKAQIESTGKASYLITKPTNLKDFTIVFDNDKVTALYKGLEFSPELSAMPQGSLLKELYGLILYFDNNEYTVYKDKDSFTVRGTADTLDFILTVTEAGLPLSLEFDENFRVVFSEVSFI